MSGTNQIYNTVLASLRTSTDTLVRLQEQAATGNRVNRASDNPADASMIMQLQTQSSYLDTFVQNLDAASLNLNQVSTGLQSISDSLIRVKELLTQAASGTFGAKDRLPVGQEIDGLLEQIVAQVNSPTVSGYLFGGSNQSSAPYEVTRSGGKIAAVTYVGAQEASTVPVAVGARQGNVVVGDAIFQSDRRSPPVLAGTTGLAAGSGTSNVRGDVWLTVTHTLTTYQDTSSTGLIAGNGSADGDTILGAGHKLVIDADARTIRLDTGAAVAFDVAADGNLHLTNAEGDSVYVDTRSFNTALTGTVEVGLTGQGRMTIDDGASYTALTSFADNTAVTDSRTGRVLYLDATALTRAGTEAIRVPGTYDVFGALISMRDVLMNTRGLSTTEQARRIGDALHSVDEISQSLTAGLTSTGAQLQALDNLKTSLGTLKEGAASQTSTLQDADIADVATELARVQTFYQMTLTAAAKVMNLSLLNYL